MKRYRLYLAKPLLALYFFALAGMILGGTAGIVALALGKSGPAGPPVWLALIWLVLVFLIAYRLLRFPFEITIRDDAMIEFRSLFRRAVLAPSAVKLVRASRYSLGFVDIVHEGGTVHLVSQMDGFHEFLTTLKELNPAVTIRGC